MNRKSISKPKFDNISQSMAEMNYFQFRKTGGAILDFHFRFLFWCMCSHRRVISHLFSKFRTDRRIGGGVVTSYRFFKMAAYSRKRTSGFRFSDGICLRRGGNLFACQISMRYLIPRLRWNYFRFRKTDGHHFGILFSVSISKEGVVSGMSFYICLPNFVVIGRPGAELWCHRFYKMAAIESEMYFRVQV